MNVTTAVVLVGAVLAGGAAGTRLAVEHPDLSGRWTFNAAQSDNPRDMLQGRDSTGDQSRGGYPGMGGGRGGYGGRGGFGRGRGGGGRGGMSDEQRQRMHQTMQLVFDAPPPLTIAETDSSVAFGSDSGAASLVLHNDGRKVTQKVEGDGDVEIKGRWQGNDFVVERKVSGGGKVTEDYLRSQDGKQLYVIVKFEGGRGRSLEFRRVYDGAAAS
jgi:hypothetical protein